VSGQALVLGVAGMRRCCWSDWLLQV
jgi:hypothetical protein